LRSPRKLLQERVRALSVSAAERYIDIAAQARVYRRDAAGLPVAGELLPRVFGGKFDRLIGRYVGPPDVIAEVKIHSGQVDLVNAIGSDSRHVLGIGPQGGGKTEGNVSVAVLLSAWRCHAIGGMVAPVDGGRQILWDKFINRVESLGWIDGKPSPKRGEIKLRNGTTLQFRSTKRQSKGSKSPIAGLDWHWVVPDEEAYMDDDELREIEARGRINKRYQIFSSATNEPIHAFQMRLLKYQGDPRTLVVRYSGPDNCFTPIEHWEALRQRFSPEDYDRYVNCKDVPREGRVYPAFDYRENTRPLPPRNEDLTSRICAEKWQVPYEYVIGWDPGVMCSASVVMKAYAGLGAGERNWFVLDEILTRDATTEYHARDVAAWLGKRGIARESVIVVGDPHENKDTDRSDYLQMQASGFAVKRSNGGVQIERKHRLAMTNALLKDANNRRRLYLAASQLGPPQATKTAECLGHLMYTRQGEIDKRHGTYQDLSHPGDAMGYALFPFEKFRGGFKVGKADPSIPVRPSLRAHGS
jgi:hypothetical protein